MAGCPDEIRYQQTGYGRLISMNVGDIYPCLSLVMAVLTRTPKSSLLFTINLRDLARSEHSIMCGGSLGSGENGMYITTSRT